MVEFLTNTSGTTYNWPNLEPMQVAFYLAGKITQVNGVNDVRAPLEPRASLIARVPSAQGALQYGCAGLSENTILGIIWPYKCVFCLNDPLFGSSSVAKMVKIGFNFFRKTLKMTPGCGVPWRLKVATIFKFTL